MLIPSASLSKFNPSQAYVDNIRELNVVLGALACITLLVCLAVPRWKSWNVPTRLGWMSLFWLCVTGTYGTFEIRYLDTQFRVPMVTIAFLWAIIAALWPRDDGVVFWSRKR